MAKPVRKKWATPPEESAPAKPEAAAAPEQRPPEAAVVSAGTPPAAQPVPVPANRPVPLAGAGQPNVPQPIPVSQAQATPAAVRAQESMAAKAKGVDEEGEEEDLLENPFQEWCKEHVNLLVSFCVHALLLIIFGLIMLPGPELTGLLIVSSQEELVEPDDLLEQDAEIDISNMNEPHPNEVFDTPPEAPESLVDRIDHVEEGKLAMSTQPPDMTAYLGPQVGPEMIAGTGRGTTGSGAGLGGRGDRRAGAGGRGASKASEDAVEKALQWLANHQLDDGSWNFDHRHGYCDGRCPNEGTGVEARNGATALALLPFLGAGYTHVQGKYKRKVASGLKFLVSRQQQTANGGSFHEPEGRMYSHGLATLALCEAYGMAKDIQSEGKASSLGGGNLNSIGKAANAALRFIEYAQHDGGGWRYEPKEAGDTSVVSWQMMALKSGQLAYLPVKEEAFAGVGKFLDSVQSGAFGAKYGYNTQGEGSATTAIGMLCRMYLGTKRDNEALAHGIDFLSEKGPSVTNLYYNYYATQVMFHYTNGRGERWQEWNERMRDHLVNTQSTRDHTEGSWYFRGGDDMGIGGRLYYTCMAAMVLEVYYRHMPIYSTGTVDDDLTSGSGDGFKIE